MEIIYRALTALICIKLLRRSGSAQNLPSSRVSSKLLYAFLSTSSTRSYFCKLCFFLVFFLIFAHFLFHYYQFHFFFILNSKNVKFTFGFGALSNIQNRNIFSIVLLLVLLWLLCYVITVDSLGFDCVWRLRLEIFMALSIISYKITYLRFVMMDTVFL